MSEGKRQMWRVILVCLALVAICAVVFGQVVRHDFVDYDDGEYVKGNPHVQQGITLDAIRWAFTTTHAANWHPLTWISLMLDNQMFGMNPHGYHLTSLLLHVLNALILLLVFYRMTGALWPSAFVAALFAVHPLHVQSVAWVAERKDVLSTLFMLLAMGAYVSYVSRRTLGRYLAVAGLLALGLMAKPMLVTFPFLLLLLDWWPLGRFNAPAPTSGKRSNQQQQGRVGWGLIVEKSPLAALALVSSLATMYAQRAGEAVVPWFALPFGERVANALVAFVAYIVKMFWPVRLAAFYPHPADMLPVWQVLGAAILLAALTAVFLSMSRRYPYLGVGWAWYLITLLPVIGLVQVGGQAMADRYTYIPLIGLFVMAAWGVPELLRRLPVPETARGAALASAGIAVVALLSVSARAETEHWKDTIALWRHAADAVEDNPVAQSGLAFALQEKGLTREAMIHHKLALASKRGGAEARQAVGATLARQGRIKDAIQFYAEALRMDPNNARAHNDMGALLMKENKPSEAVQHFRLAAALDPTLADVKYNLGKALSKSGDLSDAISYYRESLENDPNSADTHTELGMALSKQGSIDEAIEHYREALRINPRYVDALNNLGVALAQQGNLDDAVSNFREALRVDPRSAEAHNNMGIALSRTGDLDGSISEHREAIRLKPGYGEAHSNLAVALFMNGDFAGAWQEVDASRKCGHNPPPGFVQALSQKMPRPSH